MSFLFPVDGLLVMATCRGCYFVRSLCDTRGLVQIGNITWPTDKNGNAVHGREHGDETKISSSVIVGGGT